MSLLPQGPGSAPTIRFLTTHFHMLKGACYAPAGVLLVILTLAAAFVRPSWIASPVAGYTFPLAAAVLTAPWAWVMHRRYEDAYGRVRPPGDGSGSGSPLGMPSSSPWFVVPFMTLVFLWLVVTLAYIPEKTAFEGNHLPTYFAGYFTLVMGLWAPTGVLRAAYAAGGLGAAAVTLLPLAMPESVGLVQTVTVGYLGLLVAGVGLLNHFVLREAFGPLADASAPEPAAHDPSHN